MGRVIGAALVVLLVLLGVGQAWADDPTPTPTPGPNDCCNHCPGGTCASPPDGQDCSAIDPQCTASYDAACIGDICQTNTPTPSATPTGTLPSRGCCVCDGTCYDDQPANCPACSGAAIFVLEQDLGGSTLMCRDGCQGNFVTPTPQPTPTSPVGCTYIVVDDVGGTDQPTGLDPVPPPPFLACLPSPGPTSFGMAAVRGPIVEGDMAGQTVYSEMLLQYPPFSVPVGHSIMGQWLQAKVYSLSVDATPQHLIADYFDWSPACDATDYTTGTPHDALSVMGACGTLCTFTNMTPYQVNAYPLSSTLTPASDTFIRVNVDPGGNWIVPDGTNDPKPQLVLLECPDTPTPTPTNTPANTDTPTPTATVNTPTPTPTATAGVFVPHFHPPFWLRREQGRSTHNEESRGQ